MGTDDELDIFGQQPLLKIYTQITHCYPLSDASSREDIINKLAAGLERLSASFPWLAAQVVNDAGIMRFGPLENVPRLVVKDLTQDQSKLSMESLRRLNFPASMLAESVIAPRMTLPGGPNEGPYDPAPVFLVQATFITGGLLLTFVGHHGTMDMTGQGQVISLLSKACRNEPFTSDELSSGNLPRLNLIPLLDDSYIPDSDVVHQIIKPSVPRPDSPSPPPNASWAYFIFPPSSLTALKALASSTLPTPGPAYISTDDALTAFTYQSTLRARSPRLSPTSTTTTCLTRAVDVRRHLHIPPTYPGLMQNLTYHRYPLATLLSMPLGHLASSLRLAASPPTSHLAHATRALATYLARAEDKSAVSLTAEIDSAATDVMLSSWSKVDSYALDFGLGLGAPEAVRRPSFAAVEGLMYLMPRAADGEVALMVCLREEDMARLRADGEWGRYARYVG